MMRFLILSLCLLTLACGSYPKKADLTPTDLQVNTVSNSYFSDLTKDYVYKAQIEVYGKSFGGLFIIKKIGENHHRVAFTTEMGNKLFDFSFNGDNFKVNYIMDDLNKKMFINILKEDFSALIKEQLTVTDSYQKGNYTVYKTHILNQPYFYFIQNEGLEKIIKTKGGKEKTSFLFQEINDNIADQITIKHQSIKLIIQLKSI
ncbi:hypothetical protein [Mangrovimonas futianensis]|uniref:hypothetical protein n=1 Tax=Mangrovimonas futianensis TaxID=2895523 RepID=UPI001E550BB7|nr:hypothetical protein [Mangrovimonas futianensis]MCF1421058.1 hypothetical protein [Mangrovimonas futianensis]